MLTESDAKVLAPERSESGGGPSNRGGPAPGVPSRAGRAVLVVVLLAMLPVVAGCGGDARASSDTGQTTEGQTADDAPSSKGEPQEETTARERSGEDQVRAGDGAEVRPGDGDGVRAGGDAGARAGNAVAGAGDAASDADVGEKVGDAVERAQRRGGGASGGDRPERVVLKVRGDGGTRFGGSCTVGGEERRIGGKTPAKYAFEPGGEKLACEVRAKGPGALNVVLAAGDDVRSVQRSGAGGGKVSLTYAEDRISVSSQSSSGAGAQRQSSSVSETSSRDAR